MLYLLICFYVWSIDGMCTLCGSARCRIISLCRLFREMPSAKDSFSRMQHVDLNSAQFETHLMSFGSGLDFSVNSLLDRKLNLVVLDRISDYHVGRAHVDKAMMNVSAWPEFPVLGTRVVVSISSVINRMKVLARSAFWWVYLDSGVNILVKECSSRCCS